MVYDGGFHGGGVFAGDVGWSRPSRSRRFAAPYGFFPELGGVRGVAPDPLGDFFGDFLGDFLGVDRLDAVPAPAARSRVSRRARCPRNARCTFVAASLSSSASAASRAAARAASISASTRALVS